MVSGEWMRRLISMQRSGSALFASNIPTPPTIENDEDYCRLGVRNCALSLGIDQQPDCVDR
jgi:hypothetical protein